MSPETKEIEKDMASQGAHQHTYAAVQDRKPPPVDSHGNRQKAETCLPPSFPGGPHGVIQYWADY